MGKDRHEDGTATAGAEGARRATGSAPGGSRAGPLAPGQRWSLMRKREVVLRLLRGEAVELLSRELGVEIFRLERWREKALAGLDNGLREREGDPLQDELSAAVKKVGELSMENELLKERCHRNGPLALRRSRR